MRMDLYIVIQTRADASADYRYDHSNYVRNITGGAPAPTPIPEIPGEFPAADGQPSKIQASSIGLMRFLQCLGLGITDGGLHQ